MTGSTTLRHCDVCVGEVVFEQPPCVDGHDLDCPEWVCTGCGSAVVADFVLAIAEVPEAPSSGRAPRAA